MPTIVPAGQVVAGIQLPIQAQSALFAEQWEEGAGPADLAAIAQAADRAGLFYVAVCDHVGIPRAYAEKMSTTWYDTIATLSWLAAQTTKVRLLSSVFNLAYRHPLVSAKAFATLDHLSGGRVIAGVGAGHVEGEFQALGVDFARRGALLDDALDVFASALTDEFPEGYDVGLRPRPVQSPRPPIWVGGGAAPAVRRAARKADGWIPQGTPLEQMPAFVDLIHSERDAAGLDRGFDIGAITSWLYLGTPSWDVARPCVSGSAERIVDDLRAWTKVGANHLQVRFPSRSPAELVEQVEAFGAEVLPLLSS